MTHVLSQSQTELCRGEKDYRAFAQSTRRKMERQVDFYLADKEYKAMKDDRGRKMTVIINSKTGEVIGVK